jgi:hypothetical protein
VTGLVIGVRAAAVKDRTAETEMIGQRLRTRMIDEVVDVAVLRGAERVTLKLPMR